MTILRTLRPVPTFHTTTIAALAALLLPAAASAQPLADRIPQDALLYVGWRGADHLGPQYEGSHLKAVLDASDFRRLIDESVPRLMQKLGRADKEVAEVTGVISAIGAPMWRHPSAVYFGGLDLAHPDFPFPKLAFLCDAGADGKKLHETITNLVARAGQPNIPLRVEEKDGLVVVVLGSNVEISATKKPVIPLAGRKEFTRSLAQVGKDPVAVVYLDIEDATTQIGEALNRFAPDEVKQRWPVIKEATGIAGLKRAVWTGSFDGKDWTNQAFVEAPEPRTSLVKVLFDARPMSRDLLSAVPRTATMAATLQFDLGGLLGEVRTMVRKLDAQASADFEQGLDRIKQVIGMDLQQDVLDSLGTEWALYSDPRTGGTGILGLTVVNRLKDPAKAEKALTALEKLANDAFKEATARDRMTVAFTTTKVGQTTIHYLAVPAVAPGWAVRDGNLYVGVYPQTVAAAADHVAAKGRSILENEDFQAVQKRLGVTDPASVQFTDLPKVAADGYQDILMSAQAYLGLADLFGAQTPALTVPPLAKLLPHVAPAGAATWVDKDGWHMKQVMPFPGSEFLGAGAAGGLVTVVQAMAIGGVAPRAVVREQHQAAMQRGAANLRQVGLAMMVYANTHQGAFPKSLGELVLTGDLPAEACLDPAKGRAVPALDREGLAAWVDQNTDYVYLGAGKKDPAGATTVLVHEKIRPDSVQVQILFGDGHVEWLPVDRARQVIGK